MKLLVGKVLKAQGIKGEVKAECYLDNSLLLKNVKALWLGLSALKVTHIRPDGAFCFIKFDGVNDRNTAENLIDWEIFAEKDDVPISEGSFFLNDVLGCSVYLDNGTFVGKVSGIAQYGSADVYTCENAGRELSFPWLRDLIFEVKIDSKRITLKKQRFSEVAVYHDEN